MLLENKNGIFQEHQSSWDLLLLVFLRQKCQLSTGQKKLINAVRKIEKQQIEFLLIEPISLSTTTYLLLSIIFG